VTTLEEQIAYVERQVEILRAILLTLQERYPRRLRNGVLDYTERDRAIYEASTSGVKQKELAARYGLTIGSISKIVTLERNRRR
jgi:hypothetical protein